jgi:hypothetical protein
MEFFDNKTIEIYMNLDQSVTESGISFHQLTVILDELGFVESNFTQFRFNHHTKIEKVWVCGDWFYICLYDQSKDISANGSAIWRLDAMICSFSFRMSYSGWPDDTIEWAKYFMANPEIVRGLKQGQVPTILSV